MNRQKKIIVLAVVMTFCILANAHELWLQPDKFFYKAGEILKVSFKSGSYFTATSTTVMNTDIDKLELHTLTAVVDLKPNLVSNQKENISYPLVSEGTPVVIMQTHNQFIETESAIFNAYLKESGLEDAAYARESSGTKNKAGKENIRHYTKLIIQVGEKRDDTFRKVLGLPIEIIPEKNPYNVKVGDLIKFKVLANGKPLFGAKVNVWNRENNRTLIQPAYTLQDGTIEARISNKGAWMVSVVSMIPSKDKTADWQSYKGSLVFGVQ